MSTFRNGTAQFLASQRIEVWLIQSLLRHSYNSQTVLGYIREAYILAATDLAEQAWLARDMGAIRAELNALHSRASTLRNLTKREKRHLIVPFCLSSTATKSRITQTATFTARFRPARRPPLRTASPAAPQRQPLPLRETIQCRTSFTSCQGRSTASTARRWARSTRWTLQTTPDHCVGGDLRNSQIMKATSSPRRHIPPKMWRSKVPSDALRARGAKSSSLCEGGWPCGPRGWGVPLLQGMG